MSIQLSQHSRTAVDTSMRVSDLMSDERIATVMGHEDVLTAGIRNGAELSAQLQGDETMTQLVSGLPQASSILFYHISNTSLFHTYSTCTIVFALSNFNIGFP